MRFPAVFPFLLASLAVLGFGGAPIAAQAADAAQLAAIGGGDRCAPFLCVEEAFKITAAAAAPDRIEVTFKVAKGYYLYRGKLKFTAGEGQPAALGTANLPDGEKKNDEYFGDRRFTHHAFVARVPVSRSQGAFTLPIKCVSRGARTTHCYPPISIFNGRSEAARFALAAAEEFPGKPMFETGLARIHIRDGISS